MSQTCSSTDDPEEHTNLLNPHILNTHHQCLLTLKGQNSYTSSILLHGKFLLTGSSNKEIRLLSREALSALILQQEFLILGDETIMVEAGEGAVKALVLSSDKIISAHQDNKIRVWKLENLKNQKLVQLATLPTLSDRAFKILVPKNHVRITRHKKSTWVHHVDTVSALALSNDGSLLYSVSWDRTMKIWRTNDFKCLESVANAHDDAINTIVLSNDDIIYTGSSDKKIKIWKKNDKKHSLEGVLEKHSSGVNALVLNEDGTILYSGACDKLVLVWMKEGGNGMVVVGALRGHTKSILCLTVVSDLVCSGSADKTVRIWRGFGKSYSCLTVLEGHKGPVKCISVVFDHSSGSSSDTISNYILYSSSLDGDIKVWKVYSPSIPSDHTLFAK